MVALKEKSGDSQSLDVKVCKMAGTPRQTQQSRKVKEQKTGYMKTRERAQEALRRATTNCTQSPSLRLWVNFTVQTYKLHTQLETHLLIILRHCTNTGLVYTWGLPDWLRWGVMQIYYETINFINIIWSTAFELTAVKSVYKLQSLFHYILF